MTDLATQRLDELRQRLHQHPITKIALATGCTRKTLYDIRNGDTTPRVDTYYIIRTALDRLDTENA